MKKIVFWGSLLVNVLFLLAITHYINHPKSNTNKTVEYFLQRNQVLDSLPVDSNSIIFAGDSHIQQFELTELFHSLKFKNRGINYDTSWGLLKRVNELTKNHPSKIFIEIGANDLNKNVPVDRVEGNIDSILVIIGSQTPGTAIYLQSVMPNRFDLQKISLLNKKMRVMANARHITFIDLDPYFLDNGLKKQYDSGDGVHLNGEGYLKWRNVLKNYLQTVNYSTIH